MKTHFRKKAFGLVILTALIAGLYSCKKDKPAPTPGPQTNVYVAGHYTLKNNFGSACYWKNGVFFPVKDSSLAGVSVKDIAVNNNSVYMVGIYENGKPCLWKDGVKFNLSDNGSVFGGAEALLIQNNSIFIAGALQLQVGGPYYATLWKVEESNGSMTITKFLVLNPNTKNWAFGITAVGQNFYLCGKDGPANQLGYWIIDNSLPNTPANFNVLKNDMAQDASGLILDIASLNQDVYIFGAYDSGADYFYNYWKNGIASPNGISWTVSDIKAMTIDANAQVYMAGISKQTNLPGYWKGQQRTDFTSGTALEDIFVAGTDVYVSGHENSVACYWKNGTKVSLMRPNSNAIKVKAYTY